MAARRCAAWSRRYADGDDRPVDYWQCAWVFRKGRAEPARRRASNGCARGSRRRCPILGPLDQVLTGMDQMHLLTVKLDRLECWHRPACSPSAMPRTPCRRLAASASIWRSRMQWRRRTYWRGRCSRVQMSTICLLRLKQARVADADHPARAEAGAGPDHRGRPRPGARLAAALPVRLLDRFPLLRRIPGRMIGLGVRRERVRSPEVQAQVAISFSRLARTASKNCSVVIHG